MSLPEGFDGVEEVMEKLRIYLARAREITSSSEVTTPLPIIRVFDQDHQLPASSGDESHKSLLKNITEIAARNVFQEILVRELWNSVCVHIVTDAY
jgi:hypothetical protein